MRLSERSRGESAGSSNLDDMFVTNQQPNSTRLCTYSERQFPPLPLEFADFVVIIPAND